MPHIPPLHILVCPLDWGLGHASRMIPLIKEFLSQGCTITLGAHGRGMGMLKQEFGDTVSFIDFPGYTVKYSPTNSQTFTLLKQAPGFFLQLFREKQITKMLVRKLKPDVIISDNRYAVRSAEVFSVIVTHQVNICLPENIRFLSFLVNGITRYLIRKFDLCLVPDYEQEPGLAGELSHHPSIKKLIYSGPLSRFFNEKNPQSPEGYPIPSEKFILVLLSGPEEQRSVLEKTLMTLLADEPCVWFRGLPDSNELPEKYGHLFYNHGEKEMIRYYIENSRFVICRSGYSTVMDLVVFGKKALMIPTPGQTEQEYLAKHLAGQNFIATINQDDLMSNSVNELAELAENTLGLPKLKKGHNLTQIAGSIIHRKYRGMKRN